MPEIILDDDSLKRIDSLIRKLEADSKDWYSEELLPLRQLLRKILTEKQKSMCAYCRSPISSYSTDNCHIDHIAPQAHYPQFKLNVKNLCLTCSDCNKYKKNKETLKTLQPKIYPRSKDSFKIINVHFDDYTSHIVMVDEYYVGVTSKGHNTIGLCKINIRKKHLLNSKEDVEFRMEEIESYILEQAQKIASGDMDILDEICNLRDEQRRLEVQYNEYDDESELIS